MPNLGILGGWWGGCVGAARRFGRPDRRPGRFRRSGRPKCRPAVRPAESAGRHRRRRAEPPEPNRPSRTAAEGTAGSFRPTLAHHHCKRSLKHSCRGAGGTTHCRPQGGLRHSVHTAKTFLRNTTALPELAPLPSGTVPNWLGQIVTRYNALLTHPPYDTATKAKQNEAVLFFVMRRPDRDLDPLRRAEILISAQNRESSEKRTNNDNTGLAWAIWLTPCLSTNEKLCNMPKDSRGTCNS